ncbi:hypothetical protein Acid345_2171 [Candidatus Koribacter versatilis Ellin345]|uniref:Uncharacterized protein n=1 Tax=Koribacter versatilis (strain Ellin345) TaxID=204669 RepID=Q1IPM8_KORVE|nr:hypothetical protein Acid345_2171 [Candidatus Koribacter versatilis Ellin345]
MKGNIFHHEGHEGKTKKSGDQNVRIPTNFEAKCTKNEEIVRVFRDFDANIRGFQEQFSAPGRTADSSSGCRPSLNDKRRWWKGKRLGGPAARIFKELGIADGVGPHAQSI